MHNAGQDCCARSRILVEASAVDRFLAALEPAADEGFRKLREANRAPAAQGLLGAELSALLSAAGSFDGPARQSLTPQLVPPHHFANAISLNTIQWQIAEVTGPLLAGIAIGCAAEGLVVVAESKSDDLHEVRRSVAQRVRDAVGLPAKDIVLVAPGSLPKTSSGKLQRSLCKLRYLGAELQHA